MIAAAMRHRPQITRGGWHAVFYFFPFGISRCGYFFPGFAPVFRPLQFHAPMPMVLAAPPGAIARIGMSDGNRYALKRTILHFPLVVLKAIGNKSFACS